MADDVSVVIVTYNHKNYIDVCLSSVLLNKPLEIIIVDNCSTDGTTNLVKEKYPGVILIENKRNLGYGCGNNLGVRFAKGKYIIILNPDTKVEENWLHNLVCPLSRCNNIIVTPKILLYDGSKINTCGNIEHFTGLAFVRGFLEDSAKRESSEYINGISGACFAIMRDDYIELGQFDEKFFCYMEDAELSWRAHSRGFRILYESSSVIFHDYKLSVNPNKIYHLEKGRYMILRKYFTWKEILQLLPSLMMTEFLTWGYSGLRGWSGINFKLRSFLDGLDIDIEKCQCDRKKLLASLDWSIQEGQLDYSIVDKAMKKFANFIYFINYRMIVR